MRGGVVPPALFFAALACALAFAPRGSRWPAILAAIATAFASAQMPLPVKWVECIFICLWASIVIAAAFVHFPRRLSRRTTLAIAIGGGFCAGAMITVAGTMIDLAKACLWVALVVPGTWLVMSRRGVAVKVVSSWLIAIALLAAVLPIVPTPGYAPDHME